MVLLAACLFNSFSGTFPILEQSAEIEGKYWHYPDCGNEGRTLGISLENKIFLVGFNKSDHERHLSFAGSMGATPLL